MQAALEFLASFFATSGIPRKKDLKPALLLVGILTVLACLAYVYTKF